MTHDLGPDSDARPPADRPVPDSIPTTWVERMPARARPFLRLARYDRPVGFWLVALPAWIGVALARLDGAWLSTDVPYLLVFFVGAVAARGAGCTFNDIVDQKLDAQVARTADRPLPAGTVSNRDAWLFFAAQIAVCFGVLLLLPRPAQLAALAAAPLIAVYPFMKRVTWWPQAWLGLCMNWGVVVGHTAINGAFNVGSVVALAGLACWTIGYDTIYAFQDREDDALIGVKSTARLFGDGAREAVLAFFAVSPALLIIAAAVEGGDRFGGLFGGVIAAIVFGGLILRQGFLVDFEDSRRCLDAFRAHVRFALSYFGLLVGVPGLLYGLQRLF